MTPWALVVLVSCVSSAAMAPPAEADVAGLWRRVREAVDRAAEARGPRPPVPVKVTWRERRVGSIDLGAEFLAMTAADLDRDGRAEVIALTANQVVVLSIDAKGLREVARAGLGGEPAPQRPRDPVGALAIDARGAQTVVWARSSEVADAVGLAWGKGGLGEVGRRPGFPLCRDGWVELVKGRNYFAGAAAAWDKGAAAVELPREFFAGICRDDLVDARGEPLAMSAVVDLDRVMRVRCRGGGGAACTALARDIDGAGVAVEVADVDNDGDPEVLTTRGGAPGDHDRVTVFSRGAKVYAVEVPAGVVGVAAGDLDGDGDRDVVAAWRFAGSTHARFWILD